MVMVTTSLFSALSETLPLLQRTRVTVCDLEKSFSIDKTFSSHVRFKIPV